MKNASNTNCKLWKSNLIRKRWLKQDTTPKPEWITRKTRAHVYVSQARFLVSLSHISPISHFCVFECSLLQRSCSRSNGMLDIFSLLFCCVYVAFLYQIRYFVKHQTKQLTWHRIALARAPKPFVKKWEKKIANTYTFYCNVNSDNDDDDDIALFSLTVENGFEKKNKIKRIARKSSSEFARIMNGEKAPAAKNKSLLNDSTKLDKKKR